MWWNSDLPTRSELLYSISTVGLYCISSSNPNSIKAIEGLSLDRTLSDWRRTLKWMNPQYFTLAKESSVSVLTPKRGMLELVRLVLCISFFTPLICDMGFFFFSFSFWVCGEGISTSCCLSVSESRESSAISAPINFLLPPPCENFTKERC